MIRQFVRQKESQGKAIRHCESMLRALACDVDTLPGPNSTIKPTSSVPIPLYPLKSCPEDESLMHVWRNVVQARSTRWMDKFDYAHCSDVSGSVIFRCPRSLRGKGLVKPPPRACHAFSHPVLPLRWQSTLFCGTAWVASARHILAFCFWSLLCSPMAFMSFQGLCWLVTLFIASDASTPWFYTILNSFKFV